VKYSEAVGKFDDGLADLLSYNPVWYWMMSFIVLGVIVLTLFLLLRLKSKDGDEPRNVPQANFPMQQFAGEIDKTFLLVSNKVISTQEACQRVSIILREYLHLKTGLPAHSMTVTDLVKVQAPPKIIENIKYLYPIVFGDKQIATYEDFLKFMNSSRAIIDGKWN
jgi:hypothetical protein